MIRWLLGLGILFVVIGLIERRPTPLPHRPEQEEYAAVLAWLQKGQHDLYIIPCPDHHTKGTSK